MNSRSQPDRHGRKAATPTRIPRRGWRDILLRIKDKVGSNHLSITAAGIAYFSLLAIFPGLAALVSLYGLVSDPTAVQEQLAQLQSIIPADGYRIIEQQINAIAGQPGGNLSFAFLGGLLLTLLSANRGVAAMIDALNIVYEEKETRGFFKLNLLSLLYTFVMLLAVVVTLIIIVLAPALLALLPLPDSLRFLQTLFNSLQWPFLAILIILLLNFTYCYFPDRRRARWRWITPGSIFAGIAWLLASAAFSYYVSNFGNYNKTYGSVGAVVVMMIWFYLSGSIFLLGGAINAEMEHQTAIDTTTGENRPMGERGAYVADDLGEEK